ncbi:MAG: PepSY-associated TM helix domain-containing protein, partial [Candidatus Omnitrophota bacterium]
SGTLTRKIHVFSSLIVSIPFLITATSGILINHEERLEGLTKKYVSSSPTEMPPLDFKYDSLPISSEKAVEIFQNQFSQAKILRRAMLKYEHEYETLIWEVESEEGMRNPTVIDAYTAEIIKSSRQIYLAEFLDQIHEWYLFGQFSKYVVNLMALLLFISLITGWLL